MTQCKARAKGTQDRCRCHAMKGKEVCYHHGGKSLSGVASASFIHGRYSKELPDRLLGKYMEMAEDVQLMELRQDIALVDTRISDVLKRVDTGESGRLWRELRDAFDRYAVARAKADVSAMTLHLNSLTDLISEGMQDWASWDEIGKLLDRRARLVEVERKRIESAHDTMTAKQAMVLLASVVDTIRRHVTDRTILDAIATDIRARIQSPVS